MGTSLSPFTSSLQTFTQYSRRRGSRIIAYARKQVRKNSRQESQQPADRPESAKPRIVQDDLDRELPEAPSPRRRLSQKPEPQSPGDIYPVFAPKPGSPAAADVRWRWDEPDDKDDEAEGGSRSEDVSTNGGNSDVPRWNPRTGFMATAVAVQEEAAAAARTTSPASTSSPTSSAPSVSRAAASDAVDSSLRVTAASEVVALPAVSRNTVLTSAVGTGVWMAALAVFVRNYAVLNSTAAMGTDPVAVEALLRWPAGFESLTDAGVAAGAVAVVTSARVALMAVWADLREATDRSNRQVLTPLGTWDVLLVAVASGVPEELLFRGALLPATFPDWRGVLLSASLFGLLHNSGGRNPAFVVWAAAVGALYGGAFLITGNVWVPAVAHAAANATSAFLWKAKATEIAGWNGLGREERGSRRS